MTAQELSPEAAVALLRPNDSLGFGLASATPMAFMRALGERNDWTNVVVTGGLLLSGLEFFQHPGVHYRSVFFGGVERTARANGGDVQFVPSGFRQFATVLEADAPRVLVHSASMPDANGRVNLSLHHGYVVDEFRRAVADPERVVILECSSFMPRTRTLEGYSNEFSLDEIDVVIYSNEKPVELGSETPSKEDIAIARYVADFVHDGDTIQTGIGTIPNLVADDLANGDGGGYGIHSEMFTDGLLRLCQSGKVTNSNKAIFPGFALTTFALGSRALYDFLDENDTVRFAPVHVVNDPGVIGSYDNLVSINSALCIDLYGQLVADSIVGRQHSGVGGHEDFVQGTELTLTNYSLICLRATVEIDGVVHNRIMTQLPHGSVVTTPRHHTNVVVTEFGVAELRGRSVPERAVALAAIAHPQFRDELYAAAEKLAQ